MPIKQRCFWPGLLLLVLAGSAAALEIQNPRALGPVISRSDFVLQFEYYADSAGASPPQAYVAIFDRTNNASARLTPASAQSIAQSAEPALAAKNFPVEFVYDQGVCRMGISGDQTILQIAPANGQAVNIAGDDISVFVQNCKEATATAVSWPAVSFGGRDAATVPASAAIDGAVEAPSKYAPYLAQLEEVKDVVLGKIRESNLTTILSVATGVLALLALVFFLRMRKHRMAVVDVYQDARHQMALAEKRNKDELVAMNSAALEMKREMEGQAREQERSFQVARDEYTENTLIFANVIAGMVKSRERGTRALVELAKRQDTGTAGKDLKDALDDTKELREKGLAATCSDVNTRYQKTATDFILEVFDDRMVTASRLVNTGKYPEAAGLLEESFREINARGRALFRTEMTERYLQARLRELGALQAVRDERMKEPRSDPEA